MSSLWLIPAVAVGAIFGVFLIALVSTHRDDDK